MALTQGNKVAIGVGVGVGVVALGAATAWAMHSKPNPEEGGGGGSSPANNDNGPPYGGDLGGGNGGGTGQQPQQGGGASQGGGNFNVDADVTYGPGGVQVQGNVGGVDVDANVGFGYGGSGGGGRGGSSGGSSSSQGSNSQGGSAPPPINVSEIYANNAYANMQPAWAPGKIISFYGTFTSSADDTMSNVQGVIAMNIDQKGRVTGNVKGTRKPKVGGDSSNTENWNTGFSGITIRDSEGIAVIAEGTNKQTGTRLHLFIGSLGSGGYEAAGGATAHVNGIPTEANVYLTQRESPGQQTAELS